MRVTVVSLESEGLIVKSRRRRRFTIAYGEILTAERLAGPWGLRLHVRTGDSIRIPVRRGRTEIEDELRVRGVRVVDCWGAIAPTLADFEAELVHEPAGVRQSSDNA